MDLLRRYGIKEVADVTFYEIDNGGTPIKPVLYLDTLKFSNVETSSESIDAKGGKGDTALVSWDVAKEVVFNIEDALFSMRSLSFMFNQKPKVNNIPTINRCNFVQIKQEHEKQTLFEKIETQQKEIIAYERTVVNTASFSGELGYPWQTEYTTNIPSNAANVQFTPPQELIVEVNYNLEQKGDAWILTLSGWSSTEGTVTIPPFSIEFSYEIPEEGYKLKHLTASAIGLIPKKNLLEGRGLRDIRVYSGNSFLEISIDKIYTEQDLRSFSALYEKDAAFVIKSGIYLLSWKIEVDEWHLQENKEIIISANEFPGVYYMTADTWVRDESTGKDSLFQIIIPKVKLLSDQVSIEMSAEGDPAVFDFSFQALKPKNRPLMSLVAYESGLSASMIAMSIQSISQEASLACFDGKAGTKIEVDLSPMLGTGTNVLTVTRPISLDGTALSPKKLELIEKPTLGYSFVPIHKVENADILEGKTQNFSSGIYVVKGVGKNSSSNNAGTSPEKTEVVTNYLINMEGKILTFFHLDELEIYWDDTSNHCEITGYLEGTDKNVYVKLTCGPSELPTLWIYGAEDWIEKQLRENPTRFIVTGIVKMTGAVGGSLLDGDYEKWERLLALAVDVTVFLVNFDANTAEEAQRSIVEMIKDCIADPDLLDIEINGVQIIDA